jgi:hypothetical protein
MSRFLMTVVVGLCGVAVAGASAPSPHRLSSGASHAASGHGSPSSGKRPPSAVR